jgi:hypothetical protein
LWAGSLLILRSVIFFIGGILYAGGAIWKWPAGETSDYLRWERDSVFASILVAVLGLVLLERMLQSTGDTISTPLGMVTFFTCAVLVIVAENHFLNKLEWLYAPIVVYFFLVFLSQAAFGVALLQTGLLPEWIGWATIIWNLTWLVVFPFARP